MIKTQTKGKGCDFVINSASGPLREVNERPLILFLDKTLDSGRNKVENIFYF